MQTNKHFVRQGSALYQGEQVDIIDVVGDEHTGKVEYMINFGGAIWVDKDELINITWAI